MTPSDLRFGSAQSKTKNVKSQAASLPTWQCCSGQFAEVASEQDEAHSSHLAVDHLHGFPGPVHLESGGEVADAQVD